MKKSILPSSLVFFAVLMASSISSSRADETKVLEKMNGGDQSILLQKRDVNPESIDRQFEVVTNEEEIIGDPTSGWKQAYAGWKQACADWKKELKENNKDKDSQVISLNCGSPQRESNGTGDGIYSYKSKGTYKLRMRIRGNSTVQ